MDEDKLDDICFHFTELSEQIGEWEAFLQCISLWPEAGEDLFEWVVWRRLCRSIDEREEII